MPIEKFRVNAKQIKLRYINSMFNLKYVIIELEPPMCLKSFVFKCFIFFVVNRSSLRSLRFKPLESINFVKQKHEKRYCHVAKCINSVLKTQHMCSLLDLI